MANGIEQTDHLGNKFPSMAAMMRHYNICDTAFYYRRNVLGMSLEDALTAPHTENLSTAIQCTDHLGNTFPSKAAMCDYWRVPRTTFFRRIRDGWSLEDALSKPITATAKRREIKDHEGNLYLTVDEMCKHWNITKKQYMINIRNNCSIEEALTTETEWKVCRDHLGNEYTSINEMCRHYGTSKSALRSRIELGWTLKEILENPSKISHSKPVTDHKGIQYKCMKDMLKAYNVHETTFKHRINVQHMTLEQALSPESTHSIKCKDHLDNQFNSLQEMLEYWNVPTASYHSRIKTKPLKYALTHVTKDCANSFGPNLTVLKDVDDDFYEVLFNGDHVIWSSEQLFGYYRAHKDEVKRHLPNGTKLYSVTIDSEDVYVLAKQENSVNNKVKNYCKHNSIDIANVSFNGLIDYDKELTNIFWDKKAGIYNSKYQRLDD